MPNNPGNTPKPNGNISSPKAPPPKEDMKIFQTAGPSIQSLPVCTEEVDEDEDASLAGGVWGWHTHFVGQKSLQRVSLTGPNAEPDVDEAVVLRGVTAERSLSKKQKDRITKDEQRESKRFSKLLKTESKSEKAALARALQSLAALQDLHKAACKLEAKAEATHYKSLMAAQKAESMFLEARARAERSMRDGRARKRSQGSRGTLGSGEGDRKGDGDRIAECAARSKIENPQGYRRERKGSQDIGDVGKKT
ncbi:hypothetical protein F4604DRAFT_2040019 [Suillus subluteus]|nr:hypothetical protein F4604DRAFT_2040019 [Suillus subluteus]